MKNKYSYKYFALFAVLLCFITCNKEKEWLDKKSDKGTVVPETLKDFQALLDDVYTLNRFYSFLGNAGTDNFYLADEDFGSISEYQRNVYSWDIDIVWPNNQSPDWNSPFTVIEYANLVLEGLGKINPNQNGYNNLMGQAYFYRAFAYLNLSQIFCKPYNPETAQADLGLPIRSSSDVNTVEKRSNLEDLYAQIISDAQMALEYLDESPEYIQRSSKPAANALLARTYLLMEDYEKALLYSDALLQVKAELNDFNNPSEVSHSYTYKFPDQGRNNPEIIFFAFGDAASMRFAMAWPGNPVSASTELYTLYEDNDLRKEFFFENTNDRIKFVSTYSGWGAYAFGGLATNEILLIRSECYARLGNVDGALADLNYLLNNRYVKDTFSAITEDNQEKLLRIILEERRKELPQTGNIRWEDLRRLNKDSRFQKTLTKTINGEIRTLPPNDSKYVLPIPMNEILVSGIEQNTRQ